MQVLTFTYEKASGKVSDRVLMVLVKPSDKYAGIDMSDIDPVEAGKFVAKYNELHDEFLANVKALQNQFDLKHNYRQFDVDKMTNIVTI